jgi:ATP:ADP antiporter, AAA family
VGSPSEPHPGLTREERAKAAILGGWFFLTITTLWLLKPIRQASLLAHLGADELPYVRLGAVVVVAAVVAVYSRVVDRVSRLELARGASLVFALVLLAFWGALRAFGAELGTQRWFVWAVFIMVDIFATVMVGIFWTYTNDVVAREEADRIYGPIGLGGVVGGIAGGVLVDALVHAIGQIDMLLVCSALVLASALVVSGAEPFLRPHVRPAREEAREKPRTVSMLEGAREVARSRYLLLIVGIVVGYEFAAAMADFVVSVVFERAFTDETELAQMFGRLGWVVSSVGLVAQLIVVPLLLPRKRIALLVPPVVLGLATLGMVLAPVVAMAFVLGASDRGLNYSLHQATKETLYVPLTDVQKYKAKAFIDMVLDRFGKALSSIALVIVIAVQGVSITASLVVALGAIAVWVISAALLGPEYERQIGTRPPRPERDAGRTPLLGRVPVPAGE